MDVSFTEDVMNRFAQDPQKLLLKWANKKRLNLNKIARIVKFTC